MPKITTRARRALTEERRKQILAAAAQVFAAKGFERATIADIARHAGVAEGSIYNYFKNKDDLLISIPRQIVTPPIETVTARLQLLATETAEPEQLLLTIATAFTTVFRQNADVFRILLSALPTMKPAAREKYMRQVVSYAIGALETYLAQQIQCGVFRRDANPQHLARFLVGMFFPYIMLHDILQVEFDADWDYEQIIPEAVTLFLRGALAA